MHQVTRTTDRQSASKFRTTGASSLLIRMVALLYLAITLTGSARAQSNSILHCFGSTTNDGATSYAALTLAGSTLYGTTTYGGSHGGGTLFSINSDGTHYTILYNFGATPRDGFNPEAALTLVGSTLYGTTTYGGFYGSGTVFAINTSGTHYTSLYNFGTTPRDGFAPEAALTLVGSTLYGTTTLGGSHGPNGTVFSINTNGTNYTILHNFAGTDGCHPIAALTSVGSTLYGTTESGGLSNKGTVFAINTSSTNYTTILYNFGTTTGAGCFPYAALTAVGSTLYGTTMTGGSHGAGTVFAINTDGTHYTNLHNFTGVDGVFPNSLTLVGSTLYGTTTSGGSLGGGAVFAINTSGTNYTRLYNFALVSTEAESPNALTLVGSTLYGTTEAGGLSNKGTVFAISATPTVATPTFAPAGGTFYKSTLVTLSDTTSGATIYYTTNGTDPTTNSPVYTKAFSLTASATVKALATAPGYTSSAMASASYIVYLPTAATPTVAPAGGAFIKSTIVTLSDATSGATIYYTTNGTTPTTSSPVYTKAFPLTASATVKALATAPGYISSAVASASYILYLPTAATPTVAPAGGTFINGTLVTLSDTTSGATIYYTTNGTDPTTNSPVYTKAFPLTASTTVKAMARAPGFNPSTGTSASFTIKSSGGIVVN